jgi:ribosomal protein L11 methylase PrmA
MRAATTSRSSSASKIFLANVTYPALDLRFAPGPGAGAFQDMLYAELDAFEPVAIQEHETGDGWLVFFRTAAQRDAARGALASEFGNALLDLQPQEVDDEDWARRSQASLKAVRVGRIVVAPPWDASQLAPGDSRLAVGDSRLATGDWGLATGDSRPAPGDSRLPIGDSRLATGSVSGEAAEKDAASSFNDGDPLSASRQPPAANRQPPAASRQPPAAGRDILIVIDPSMGFGTGHHATTRLCLALLQKTDVSGRRVIDIGTGSGVLALAAWALGASRVTALDNDPDALHNARENIARNGGADGIEVVEGDLAAAATLHPADVVLANLTAAVLRRHAAALQRLIVPGGTLIASGFSADEIDEIAQAFGVTPQDIAAEGEWAALTLRPLRHRL